MQVNRVIRSRLSHLTSLSRTVFSSTYIKPFSSSYLIKITTISTSANDFCFPLHFASYSTSNLENLNAAKTSELEKKHSIDCDNETNIYCDDDEEEEDVDLTDFKQSKISYEGLANDVQTLVSILREFCQKGAETRNKIEQCGIEVSPELVREVLSRVRNDWEAAFTFFLWAGKQPGYSHSTREYHSMISILGKGRKFDTAWALIDEMRGGTTGPSLVTKQTLLILIRRYCAVHNVGRAINAFYAYKRFKFDVDVEDFQDLLSALCRYKNVQHAEHLMFCNKDVFPFNTKSINIILNGWCNVIGSSREAERVWMKMSNMGIQYDVFSFSSIISCYSKASNLHKVLRLFDQMKKTGIEPDRKVYNAVIHALAKGRLEKDAVDLMRSMEEKGIAPNVVTYNSLIKPLCKAQKVNEARQVFNEMLQRGLSPTIQTYHAFLHILRTAEEVFELVENMRKMGCQPTNDTYIMLIRKFSRWRQFDNVFKVWSEMSEHGNGPDRSSYIVLIHGLFLNGKLEEAHKYYTEMKEKQFLPEHKTDEMLQDWLSNKQCAARGIATLIANQSHLRKNTRVISKNSEDDRECIQQPETRRVFREGGVFLLGAVGSK